MSRLTIFSFGYYGWGNHTPNLIKAVDAVERSRGFKPPIFVDIRIRRSVRAAGFTGNAFEELLGEKRHRWMKSLGNKFIQSKKGQKIQIAIPNAANDLLDLAIEAEQEKLRVLFFCSCPLAKVDGEIHCHRATVAELVQKAAKSRRVSTEIIEWPGEKPTEFELKVASKEFKAIQNGKWTIPLGDKPNLAKYAALPWCSICTLRSDGESLRRLVGPAISQNAGWALPIQFQFDDSSTSMNECRKEASAMRKERGWEPIRS